MQFFPYTILSNDQIVPDVFVFKLKPTNNQPIFPFLAGQFCQVKNPTFTDPSDARSFSIASTPNTKDYLELCIKRYGLYSQALTSKKVGEIVEVAGPLGHFTWDETAPSAVFLAGGVGIAPLLSSMRYLQETGKQPKLTLFYGNRDEVSIAYRAEIEAWFANQPQAKLVHVLSLLVPQSPWQGYRGFITKEILDKELDFSQTPTFYVCGPPIFVQLMKDTLKPLVTDLNRIRQEIYSVPPRPKT